MHVEPPIIKLTERLQIEIEQAVRRFARFHRYELGADLRREIRTVARLANRAWRDRAGAARWTRELVWAVDELKHSMQIGKAIGAFASFNQFEMLVRLAEELGRQCGGWNRQFRKEHPQGQNAAGVSARPQRAQTLSTPAASQRGYA